MSHPIRAIVNFGFSIIYNLLPPCYLRDLIVSIFNSHGLTDVHVRSQVTLCEKSENNTRYMPKCQILN